MPNSLLIRLPAVSKHPSSEVSELARQKAKFYNLQIPVSPLVVIPKNTLLLVAKQSGLAEKLEPLLKQALFRDRGPVEIVKKKVLRAFKSINLPESFKASLINEYYDYLGGNFVNISIASGSGLSNNNVVGDASVFDSLFNVWAENFFFLYQFSPKNISKLQLLSEHPILIEQSIQANSSGIAYTINPATLEKNLITIYSTWGNFVSDQNQPLDSFVVNQQNQEVVQSQVLPKPTQFQLVADGFRSLRVPERQRLVPSLDVRQLQQLAGLVSKVKKQFLEQLEIRWSFDGRKFYIESTKPLDLLTLPQEHKSRTRKYQQTRTKLYISTGNPDLAGDHLSVDTDGVGIFRSEYTVAKLGFHPNFVMASKYKKVLEQEFVGAISAYQTRLQGKPFLFRSLNMTSEEILPLQYGNQYEIQEKNAYLGFRGGMRLLANPEWFDFELKVINQALKKYRSPIGLIIPFVRTPGELSQLLTQVESAHLNDYAHFSSFLQINTPANLIDIANYPLDRVSGIIANIKSLHGLATGIDPDDKELFGRYPINYGVMAPLLTSAIKTTKKYFTNLQVLIHLEEYHASLAQMMIAEGIDGLIVKPAIAERVRQDIIDSEKPRIGEI